MPEELVKPEELSKYRQVASHVVSGSFPQTWETGSSGLLPGGRGAGQHGALSRASRPLCFSPWPLSCQGFSSCPAAIGTEGVAASGQKAKHSGQGTEVTLVPQGWGWGRGR